jgi:PAS domain S-box-containing protein
MTNPQKVAVARLLTAQKNKYKKLLHETHERLHIIADMTSSLEFWYNVNGGCEFVSPACELLTGYKADDFRHKHVALDQILHPDSLARFRDDRHRTLEGQAQRDVEYRLVTRAGETRWVSAGWSPVTTRQGKHIGFRVSLRDISDFKLCQHFSHAYRSLALQIADQIDDTAMVSISPEGTIRFWSRGAAVLTGHDSRAMTGKDFASIFTADASLPDMAAFGDGQTAHAQAPLRRADGSTCDVHLSFIPLPAHGGGLHLVTVVMRSIPVA